MKNTKPQVLIFGEVLFDCFPTGEQVLGGAPFNVSWHLQALNDQPRFISQVGNDEFGEKILNAMDNWGMDTTGVHIDTEHPTGKVEIEMIDGEPHYTIVPDCAYDFIGSTDAGIPPADGILYHGTLGLRNKVARETFMQLAESPGISIFLDVNLRPPWWQREEVYTWLEKANWVKLNVHEMRLLGFTSTDMRQAMKEMVQRFQLEQLILTRGQEGAIVLTNGGEFHTIQPEPITHVMDTVGAGDAFSAIFIHGIIAEWTVPKILNEAQEFAGRIIGVRGAISTDPDFYQNFIEKI